MRARAGLVVLLLSLPAYAGSAGGTGAAFLDLPIGARGTALGEAYTSAGPDPFALMYNPANIGSARRRDIALSYNDLFLDLSYTYLSYVHPLRERGTLGWTFGYVDLGEVQRTTLTSPGGGLGTASGNDVLLNLTYAYRLDRMEVGVSAKYIREKLDAFNAGAFAVDFGARWRPSGVPGLSVGAAVLNLGTDLRFNVADEPLPATLRVGADYKTPTGRWEFMGDVVWVREQDVEGHFGVEWWAVERLLALRMGIDSSNDAEHGLSFGLGLEHNDFRLDYAYTPFGDLGDNNQVSIAYAWGSERPLARAFPADIRPAAARDVGSGTGGRAARIGGRVYVSPIDVHSTPGTEWFGAALQAVIEDALEERGVLLGTAREAEYLVDCVIRTYGERFVVTGRVAALPKGEEIGGVEALGTAVSPFEAWEDARDDVLRALSPHVGIDAPAARRAPAVRVSMEEGPPVRRVAPAPAPMAPAMPTARLAVGSFTNLTGDASLAYLGREFSAALHSSLSRRGLVSGGRAATDVTGSFFVDGDRVTFLAKAVDAATGRTLAAFEVAADGADAAAAADRLARDLDEWLAGR